MEVPGGKGEAPATPEHGVVRERREEVGSETEGMAFVGKTVHVYDHRMLELLADTAVYHSGAFVLHDRTAMRWISIAAVDAYDFMAADLPIVRWLQQRHQRREALTSIKRTSSSRIR